MRDLLAEFNTFTGNYNAEDDDIEMKHRLLDAAQTVVEQYLGYSLDEEEYVEDYVGTGSRVLYLHNQPIQEVLSVTIDDEELSSMNYEVNGDNIRIAKSFPICFKKDAEIQVDYISGYGKRIPPIIVQTILRIASLMLQEANSNIGTSGVSLPDGISRSFVSYSNYAKYLQPLNKLRSFEI